MSTCKTADGNFVTEGQGNSPFADFALIKTDTMGNVIWSTQLYDSMFYGCAGIIGTSDSGIVIVGYQYTSTVGQICYMKLNANGQLLWSRAISTSISNT